MQDTLSTITGHKHPRYIVNNFLSLEGKLKENQMQSRNKVVTSIRSHKFPVTSFIAPLLPEPTFPLLSIPGKIWCSLKSLQDALWRADVEVERWGEIAVENGGVNRCNRGKVTTAIEEEVTTAIEEEVTTVIKEELLL